MVLINQLVIFSLFILYTPTSKDNGVLVGAFSQGHNTARWDKDSMISILHSSSMAVFFLQGCQLIHGEECNKLFVESIDKNYVNVRGGRMQQAHYEIHQQ